MTPEWVRQTKADMLADLHRHLSKLALTGMLSTASAEMIEAFLVDYEKVRELRS